MNENIKTEIFPIGGMHCKSCADGIEENLRKLDGVNDVKVNFSEKKIKISFDTNKTSIDKIKDRIISLGYSIAHNTAEGSSCCSPSGSGSHKDGSSVCCEGVLYGIIPHIGCIAFLIGSILGVTVLTSLFKPLLLNPFSFYILILLSLIFATISSILYLKKNNLFSLDGAKSKWKYLTTMYGTTIAVNLLFFFFIFPLLANAPAAQQSPAPVITNNSLCSLDSPCNKSLSEIENPNIPLQTVQQIKAITLEVSIPCPGHASLITNELKTIRGIKSIRFDFPNKFYVEYDASMASEEQILGLEIFKTYPAKIV